MTGGSTSGVDASVLVARRSVDFDWAGAVQPSNCDEKR